MDFLTGYSSDDSSLDHEHHVRTVASSDHEDQSENQKSQNNVEIHNSPEKNTDHIEDNKDEESDSEPESKSSPVQILSYSQEYTMNVKRHNSAFAYLPWSPTREIKNRMQTAGNMAARKLKESVANFDQRFSWNSTIASRTTAHGTFGVANKKSLTNPHISLFPNTVFPSHKYRQFLNNVKRATKSLPVPPEVLHSSSANKLDMLLSDGKVSETQKLRFRLDPKLHLYKSTKSGSLFVGVGLSKFTDPSWKAITSQYKYLASVSRAIEEQANLLDFDFSWSQFNVPQKGKKGDLSRMYYHLSLIVCELKPLGKRMDDAEYTLVKEAIGNIDVSELLGEAYLEADHFVITTRDKSSKEKAVKIPLV